MDEMGHKNGKNKKKNWIIIIISSPLESPIIYAISKSVLLPLLVITTNAENPLTLVIIITIAIVIIGNFKNRVVKFRFLWFPHP